MNLRASFLRGCSSPLQARHIFTNRTSELAVFEAAERSHAEWLRNAQVSPVVDRNQGRRNVLSFFGVGGIGKTALSVELERRFRDRPRAAAHEVAVAMRIDLAEPGATDLEHLLVQMRAALGRLGSRWPAFDLALSCYWARAHPGEALHEFLDASPMLRRAARSVGLDRQIYDNIAMVAPVELGGLPGIAQKAAAMACRMIRDRVREGKLMADCDLFLELVEADADYETLSFFPYLLAWDLERAGRRRRPAVCVFLDTFEVLTDRPDRTAERHVQRMIYLMPNVLFVATGRNRIDWAEANRHGELDFTGRHRWPNLRRSNETDEPRQHAIGYLSATDSDRFLRDALVLGDEPAMPDDIRRRVVAAGGGLPLYLDLAVSHFVELTARNPHPSLDDFGGSFTAVATRTIRDLPPEERDLVRTAALVDYFDGELLRSGQPLLSEGAVTRFLHRPFLDRDDTRTLPYSLHQTLRDAIAEADRELSDGWSDGDRRDVAGGMLRALGSRLGPATDRFSAATALEIGLSLAGRHGLFDAWLVDATQRLVEAGRWAWLSAAVPSDSDGNEMRALRAAVEGIVLRRSGRATDAVATLEAASNLTPTGMAGELVRLHLAHALRNTGDYGRAAASYRELASGPFGGVARYWLCDHDFLNGRFEDALRHLTTTRTGSPAAEGERLRLIGHVLRVNARFADARETYDQAVELARDEGLVAAEAKALANVAQTACWQGDAAAVADATAQARSLLAVEPNRVELVKLRAAEAAVAAVDGHVSRAAEAVADTRRLADDIGYRGGHNLADVASILSDARVGDDRRARRTVGLLAERTARSGGNTYWVPIALSWLDLVEGLGHEPVFQWLDGADATLRRWAAVARP